MISGLCVAVPSVIATFMNNASNRKLTMYRIDKLEEKVDKHNNFAERIPVLEEKIKVEEHRIEDLEKFHQPN